MGGGHTRLGRGLASGNRQNRLSQCDKVYTVLFISIRYNDKILKTWMSYIIKGNRYETGE